MSFSSVQSLICVQLFATPWTAARQASQPITNSWSVPKLMSIESVVPSSHLILCHPLLLPHSTFTSIRVFSNESVLRIWWPKYWSFSFSISPSNEYSGLNSFRVDWLDLLSVQGTLQHHSSKASILRLSAASTPTPLIKPYLSMNGFLLICMEKVGKADWRCCKLMITNLQRVLIPTHRVSLASRFCFSPEASLTHPALSLCQQAASPLFTQKLNALPVCRQISLPAYLPS